MALMDASRKLAICLAGVDSTAQLQHCHIGVVLLHVRLTAQGEPEFTAELLWKTVRVWDGLCAMSYIEVSLFLSSTGRRSIIFVSLVSRVRSSGNTLHAVCRLSPGLRGDAPCACHTALCPELEADGLSVICSCHTMLCG